MMMMMVLMMTFINTRRRLGHGFYRRIVVVVVASSIECVACVARVGVVPTRRRCVGVDIKLRQRYGRLV